MDQGLAPVRGVHPPDRATRERHRTSGPLVLVVDDEPSMRLLHAINLEAAGIVVVAAADGAAAVSLARSEQPDLVISDVSMPGMDGFEVAGELRRDPRTSGIPLLFVSGETGGANEARAIRLGAVGYVTKPFDPAALTAQVMAALNHRREQFAGAA